MADQTSDYGTVIGPDATFRGDFEFDSAAKILGKIEGSISSKGRIHVADGSVCKATVKAKEVAVEGRVEGNIEAADKVDLRPKGNITGDIVAARMSMAEGASIDGHCRIGVDGAQPRTRSGNAPSIEVKPGLQPLPPASSNQPQLARK